jgi:hypothetical protein
LELKDLLRRSRYDDSLSVDDFEPPQIVEPRNGDPGRCNCGRGGPGDTKGGRPPGSIKAETHANGESVQYWTPEKRAKVDALLTT